MEDAAKLLEELRPWLLAVAHNFSKDPGMKADLAQEGWIEAWRAIATHDAAKGPLIFWMKYKAKWKIMQVWNARSKEVLVETDDVLDISSYDNISSLYHNGVLNKILAGLSKAEREFIEMRFIDGLSIRATVGKLGYEVNWEKLSEKLRRSMAAAEDYA